MKIFKRFIALSLIVVILGLATQIDAAIYNKFSTKAIIPSNQINKKAEYFDLKVTKTTKQNIYIYITNQGTEDMYANVKLNNATTSNNGGVVYTKDLPKDSSLKKGLSELAKVTTPKILIPANSTKKAKINLDMSKYEFDGVILGGVSITAETKNQETSKNNSTGIKTDNEIAFVTGIKLTMSNEKIARNLNLVETKADLINYKTAVTARIQNDKPVLMKGAAIEGNIYKKDSDNSLSSVDLKNVDIAPNSSFRVVYDWDNNRLKDGIYRISMKAHHQGKTWTWDEEFEIKDASKINDKAFKLNNEYALFIIIGGALLILILLIILIVLRRRKKEEA